MKTPRVKDFDPDAKLPQLKSSMEDMPVIGKPPRKEEKASLLANQQTSKLANQFTSKEVNEQTSMEANYQTSKLPNQQISKEVNQQTSNFPLSTKDKKKYGTYLREDSILDIQITAAKSHKKDQSFYKKSLIYISSASKSSY